MYLRIILLLHLSHYHIITIITGAVDPRLISQNSYTMAVAGCLPKKTISKDSHSGYSKISEKFTEEQLKKLGEPAGDVEKIGVAVRKWVGNSAGIVEKSEKIRRIGRVDENNARTIGRAEGRVADKAEKTEKTDRAGKTVTETSRINGITDITALSRIGRIGEVGVGGIGELGGIAGDGEGIGGGAGAVTGGSTDPDSAHCPAGLNSLFGCAAGNSSQAVTLRELFLEVRWRSHFQ